MSTSSYRPSSRVPSPYSRPMEVPYETYHSLPTGPARVGPGATTYSTSTTPDGRVIYHLFKAVAATYQTPNGMISGIQWLPAETTSVLPPGVLLPEHAGFVHKEESRATLDWQRADEKRRKQEEKEARRLREMHSRNSSEYELQLARERDGKSMNKERRRSQVIGSTASASGGVAFPQPGTTIYSNHSNTATGYPPSPYGHGYGNLSAGYAGSGGHSRSASVGTYDVAQHMKDMDLNKGERERKVSIGGTRVYGAKDVSPYQRTRTISGNLSDRSNPYSSPPGTYASGSGPYGSTKGQYSSASPNIRPRDFPYGTAGSTGYPSSNLSSSPGRSATGGFGASPGGYPPSHVLYDPKAANQPRSRAPSRAGSRPASRAASRAPSRAPSPNPGLISRSASPFGRSAFIPGEPQQLPAPEAFSRAIIASNSFSPFDPVKILDMDEVYDKVWKLPKMPIVLSTHDVRSDDWKRCMQDLARSWTGQLPVAGDLGGRPPKKSKLAQDLIELWNTAFFAPRGVELVLFKGQQRRTKSQAAKTQHFFDSSDDDYESSSTDSSDLEGSYGRAHDRQHEERRKRRKERKAKRRAYTVYVACVNAAAAPLGAAVPQPVGYPMPMAAPPYAVPPPGYPVFMPPGVAYPMPYGPPGIPKTRSHGQGGGY